jgi:thymidylate synthase (FAD)
MDIRNVEIISYTPNPEELIERAGRICHQSDINSDTREKFIKNVLIKREHFSVLEHASVTFQLTNMSRACSHQLVRHRIASYSQRSQRYTKIVKPEDFVIPDSITDPAIRNEFTYMYGESLGMYHRLLGKGVKPEDARYILPAGTITSIIMTMNFSSLRHFFKMRLAKKAQQEIRSYAEEMLRQVLEIAPAVFTDIDEGYKNDKKWW